VCLWRRIGNSSCQHQNKFPHTLLRKEEHDLSRQKTIRKTLWQLNLGTFLTHFGDAIKQSTGLARSNDRAGDIRKRQCFDQYLDRAASSYPANRSHARGWVWTRSCPPRVRSARSSRSRCRPRRKKPLHNPVRPPILEQKMWRLCLQLPNLRTSAWKGNRLPVARQDAVFLDRNEVRCKTVFPTTNLSFMIIIRDNSIQSPTIGKYPLENR
jgi:hypothetical protein